MSSVQESQAFLPQEVTSSPRFSRRRLLQAAAAGVFTLGTAACRKNEQSSDSDSFMFSEHSYEGEGIEHKKFPGEPTVVDWDIVLNANAIIGKKKGRWEAVSPDGTIFGSFRVIDTDLLSPVTLGTVQKDTIEGTDIVKNFALRILKPDLSGRVTLKYYKGAGDPEPSDVMDISLEVSAYSKEESNTTICSKKPLRKDLFDALNPALDISHYGIHGTNIFIVPPGHFKVTDDIEPVMEPDFDGNIVLDRLNTLHPHILKSIRKKLPEKLWEAIVNQYTQYENADRIEQAVSQMHMKVRDFQDILNSEASEYITPFKEPISYYDYLLNTENYPDIRKVSFDDPHSHNEYSIVADIHNIFTSDEFKERFVLRYNGFYYSGVDIKSHDSDNGSFKMTQQDIARFLLFSYYDLVSSLHSVNPKSPELSVETQDLFEKKFKIFNTYIENYPPGT